MTAKQLLQQHKLKRTSCREGMLELFLASKEALSENELREQLSGSYDRTTFYRSFITLLDAGIIHKIVVDNILTKYALTTPMTREHQHVHFFCTHCETTKCIQTDVEITIQLPEGFHQDSMDILIKGSCNHCKQ
ncbi:MAG: transcriptional repressor [Bacteroidales bacterium]|jgi:Fur family ferric uptake transcriptional regulator|nr:transcriptional repressor [Bacteroidales bacterium]